MDKQPMQADGDGDEAGEIRSRPGDKGESAGGAYPNPHSGKDGDGFEGGQSGKAYHGGGQLGEDVVGDNANAPSTGD